MLEIAKSLTCQNYYKMSNLQLCEATLLQSKRSNYVAKIWKSCASARCDCTDTYRNGWNVNFSIKSIKAAFLQNVEDLIKPCYGLFLYPLKTLERVIFIY